MRTLRSAVLVCVWLAFLAMPASAQIVNGSFEPAAITFTDLILPGNDTSIPGWTTSDFGVQWFYGAHFSLYTFWGECYVDVDNPQDGMASGIQQTFSTIPGHHYEVTFELGTTARSPHTGTATIHVSAAGQSAAFGVSASGVGIVWRPQVFDFVADSNTATLLFRSPLSGYGPFVAIDDVAAVDIDLATPTRSSSWGGLKSRYR